MFKNYQNYSINKKTLIWGGGLIILFSILLLPLYFLNLKEIPLGFLLGATVVLICLILISLLDNKFSKEALVFTIILLIFRFLLLGGTLFLSAYLYYKLEIHLFNVFAVIGGYLLPLIVYLIIFLKEKRN